MTRLPRPVRAMHQLLGQQRPTHTERRTRQRNRALTALFWRAGKLWTPPQFAPELRREVDHAPSNDVEKRQAADHHPKPDPDFFERSSSADTSAVRSSLSPDECTCGLAWEGHPNPHAITCPQHRPPADGQVDLVGALLASVEAARARRMGDR